jgi:penicillin amidase
VRSWNGRASPDSAAYRLVRAFRSHTAERTFKPFFERAEDYYDRFSWRRFNYEDALWQLVHEKPVRMLNPAHNSWDSLLLAAADDVLADADKAGVTPAKFTWGRFNTLKMQHPFGRFLPGPLARMLDMPAAEMAGDSNMPRVLNPGHGASERLVVAPGHEAEAIFHMPGGQSGNPLSPFYRAGHDAWAKGEPTSLLPGPAQHTLVLKP